MNKNTKARAVQARKDSKRLGYVGACAAGVKGAVPFGETIDSAAERKNKHKKPANLPAGHR